VTESATLEPVVIDSIERYFDQLQAHVSAQDMIEHVLTTDFETGFSNIISLMESRTVGVDHDARAAAPRLVRRAVFQRTGRSHRRR
jgi:hypothetical protein